MAQTHSYHVQQLQQYDSLMCHQLQSSQTLACDLIHS